MTDSIHLVDHAGRGFLYRLSGHQLPKPSTNGFISRSAFSAAHVVADPAAFENGNFRNSLVDWDATLKYRHYLWDQGFAIAEAMDTAQRGMGLDWVTARELIARTIIEARHRRAIVFSGIGTDQLAYTPRVRVEDVIAAYDEQLEAVEALGGRIIVMASRALAACAADSTDYARVYDHILTNVSQPVILHWLGDMFDPQLSGYWGSKDTSTAMCTVLDIIRGHADKIDGIKISLLNADLEISMRRQLPPGVRMYTGDDFNYPALIKGDNKGYSHALLGIFDAIAPAAAAAFGAMDRGDLDAYDQILAPTVALARHIFQAPTYSYKTGITFLAYLNGFQSHFRMIGGQETARSAEHLAELFVLADRCGLLREPDLAIARMRQYLAPIVA